MNSIKKDSFKNVNEMKGGNLLNESEASPSISKGKITSK